MRKSDSKISFFQTSLIWLSSSSSSFVKPPSICDVYDRNCNFVQLLIIFNLVYFSSKVFCPLGFFLFFFPCNAVSKEYNGLGFGDLEFVCFSEKAAELWPLWLSRRWFFRHCNQFCRVKTINFSSSSEFEFDAHRTLKRIHYWYDL